MHELCYKRSCALVALALLVGESRGEQVIEISDQPHEQQHQMIITAVFERYRVGPMQSQAKTAILFAFMRDMWTMSLKSYKTNEQKILVHQFNSIVPHTDL